MAKFKTKPKPRGNLKSEIADCADDAAAASSDLGRKNLPAKPQPLMFKLALALFVGWLLYLAYIAYVVMS